MEGVEQVIDSLLDPTLHTWSQYLYHMKAAMGGYPSYQRYVEYCAAKYFTLDQYQKCRTKYTNTYLGVETWGFLGGSGQGGDPQIIWPDRFRTQKVGRNLACFVTCYPNNSCIFFYISIIRWISSPFENLCSYRSKVFWENLVGIWAEGVGKEMGSCGQNIDCWQALWFHIVLANYCMCLCLSTSNRFLYRKKLYEIQMIIMK